MDTFGLIQLAELIYEYCGIDFFKNLSSLESKISERLKELGLSCWEYGGYLRVEPKEWDTLIDLITVNETYFFREENLLEEFQKVILPKYKDRTPNNPLRIWSSACSSGEEPYTLAILSEETGLFETGAVEIIASDIDKKVLEKARRGLYNKKSFSFRTMPKEILDKYFISFGDDYKVKDSIKAMVDFRRVNLLDENILERVGEVDIIFCRNVLIYFDTKAINKVINSLYKVLRARGYLFLGHAETITGMNTGFETIYTPSAFYYRKGERH
ncbi:protein-glutamate O-methyltransferase CheR [Acetivibrio thermocellus]|uniref:CheR family methyltransferase n=1 Tax=Acetivibrio thermocellus TaxID=1515 RepID=UPI0010A5D0C9|nr:protein-glutamate O-methyltransferase CheR [Acetivibrio thermocellus]THJ77508.1 protein-glutamate O-methyltransferase CheR [Acetivibrio thermocellus]UWV46864.1 protein-glutamate O-methyltransferase CheR [Acetivibrio thermocellus]